MPLLAVQPSRFARFVAGLVACLLPLGGWLAAQPEPARKVRQEEEEPAGPPRSPPKVPREEEEEAPRTRVKVPVVVGDEPTGLKRPTAKPAPAEGPNGFVNLQQEALKARLTPVKEFFRSTSIPYDLLITKSGYQYRIGLLPDREPPVDELEFTELNAKLSAGTRKKMAAAAIGEIRPYEEVVLAEAERFLRSKVEGLSRADQLDAAAKALTAAVRFHQAAREQNKRVGKGWDVVVARLRTRLLAIQRDELKALEEAWHWDRAEALASFLSGAHPDDPEVAKDVAHLHLLRAEQAPGDSSDEELLTLRDLMLQFERHPGGPEDPLTLAVRKRLRARAEECVRQARDLAGRNQNAGALARLRSAELLDPDLAGVRELRTRLKDRVLYVAVPSLPQRMSPLTALSESEHWALDLLFEGLLQVLPDPEVGRAYRPVLAEALPEMAPLGRDFRLRRNVRWCGAAAGETLDARDVRGTLTMLLDPRFSGSPAADGLGVFDEKGLRVEDPFRLRLPFKQGVLEPLARMTFPVMPAEWLRRNRREPDDDDFAQRPFGTGPYRYEGREREGNNREVAVFRANPYYGQRPGGIGLPLIREIRFCVPKPADTPGDFRAGQLHLLPDVPTDQFLRYRNDQTVNALVRTFTVTEGRRIYLLAVNHRRPALRSAEVRRGLSLAIDREAILKAVFRADGERFHRALTGPFPPRSWATPAKAPDLSKPELARALLGEAGRESAVRLTLKFPADDARAAQACRLIKEQVEQAAGPSAAIILDPLPADVLRKKVELEHDYELAYYTFDYRDDLFRLDGLLDPSAGGRGGRNFLGYLTEGSGVTEQDRRLAQAMADLAAHRDFCHQVRERAWELHHLFNQQAPFVPLWQLDRHLVVSNSVELHLGGDRVPASPAQIDPNHLLTGVERWRLK